MRWGIVLVGIPVAFAMGACSAGPPPEPPSLTSAVVPTGRLDDAQIVTIGWTIDQQQAMLARVAVNHGKAPQVKAVARQLTADAPGALVAALPYRPVDSPQNQERTHFYFQLGTWLYDHGGHSFDRAFVTAEQEAMSSALDLVGGRLLRDARDPLLRANLEQMRATLSRQLSDIDRLGGEIPPQP